MSEGWAGGIVGVVAAPSRIAAQPRGWNRPYVALTRCTQELGQIRVTG